MDDTQNGVFFVGFWGTDRNWPVLAGDLKMGNVTWGFLHLSWQKQQQCFCWFLLTWSFKRLKKNWFKIFKATELPYDFFRIFYMYISHGFLNDSSDSSVPVRQWWKFSVSQCSSHGPAWDTGQRWRDQVVKHDEKQHGYNMCVDIPWYFWKTFLNIKCVWSSLIC